MNVFFLNAYWFQIFASTKMFAFCYNTVSRMCECARNFEGYNFFSLQLVRVFFCKRNYWYCFMKLVKLCGYLKLVSKFISIWTIRKICVRCVFFKNKDPIINQLCKSLDCQSVVFTRRSRNLKWNLSIVYKTKSVWM